MNPCARGREFEVGLINQQTTANRGIFVGLVATNPTRSPQIIQLLLIPIDNAMMVVTHTLLSISCARPSSESPQQVLSIPDFSLEGLRVGVRPAWCWSHTSHNPLLPALLGHRTTPGFSQTLAGWLDVFRVKPCSCKRFGESWWPDCWADWLPHQQCSSDHWAMCCYS